MHTKHRAIQHAESAELCQAARGYTCIPTLDLVAAVRLELLRDHDAAHDVDDLVLANTAAGHSLLLQRSGLEVAIRTSGGTHEQHVQSNNPACAAVRPRASAKVEKLADGHTEHLLLSARPGDWMVSYWAAKQCMLTTMRNGSAFTSPTLFWKVSGSSVSCAYLQKRPMKCANWLAKLTAHCNE